MKNRVYSLGIVGVSVVLNLLLWILSITIFPQDSPVAILHYNAIVGVDFIGGGHQIYILPLIGVIILVGNIVVGLVVQKTSDRSRWLLLLTSVFVQIILLVSFAILWRLNH